MTHDPLTPAEIEELEQTPARKCIANFAKQRLESEMPEDERDDADYRGAYDCLIREARAASKLEDELWPRLLLATIKQQREEIDRLRELETMIEKASRHFQSSEIKPLTDPLTQEELDELFEDDQRALGKDAL